MPFDKFMLNASLCNDRVITTRKRRMVFGVGFKEGKPSRFLEDLDKQLYKQETLKGSPFGARQYSKGYAMV
jgi:hypothetical protein